MILAGASRGGSMTHIRKRPGLAVLIFFWCCSFPAGAAEYRYDPDADPYRQLEAAGIQATEANKLVLVVFGSEWCPDCRSFNSKLGEPPLSDTVESNFQVVHVDVGNWDRNIEFTRQFGKPIDEGIPSIAILGPDLSLHFVAEAGEFASARHSKVTSLNDWFSNILARIRDGDPPDH